MIIDVECLDGHKQALLIRDELSPDLANNLAQLLDGSSKLYLAPNQERKGRGTIGYCGICGQPFTCKVREAVKETV